MPKKKRPSELCWRFGLALPGSVVAACAPPLAAGAGVVSLVVDALRPPSERKKPKRGFGAVSGALVGSAVTGSGLAVCFLGAAAPPAPAFGLGRLTVISLVLSAI